MRDNDGRLIERVRAALDAGVEGMDPATAARLRSARQEALAPRRVPGWWLPVGVAATTALLVVGLWLGRPAEVALAPMQMAADPRDLELLTAEEGLEFYRDLDFYRWLALEDGHAG